MPSRDTAPASPIRVGVVGVRPGEHDGILADLPQGDMFQFVAFSDEGLENPGVEYRPAAYYGDYNSLLQDPTVELVLVDGPVARRRDFALRALNSGRHVVLAPPFCETAADAERVMKTALRCGLAATMDMPWRADAGFRALRAALAAENVGPVHGLLASLVVELPSESDATPVSLLGAAGMALLDQVRLLLSDDVKSVAAHLRRPTPVSPDEGFLVYMPLRSGGWAIAEACRGRGVGLPRWAVYAARAGFRVDSGVATVLTGGEERTYGAPPQDEGFWQNVRAALRSSADLRCHPADIVRAMKLHEAALESAETGSPVVV